VNALADGLSYWVYIFIGVRERKREINSVRVCERERVCVCVCLRERALDILCEEQDARLRRLLRNFYL